MVYKCTHNGWLIHHNDVSWFHLIYNIIIIYATHRVAILYKIYFGKYIGTTVQVELLLKQIWQNKLKY